MKVMEAIQERHAYRKLTRNAIGGETIDRLIEAARLAPSCYNNQPWRFVFVTDPDLLEELQGAYSKGNEWIRNASMVAAVFTSPEMDCVIGDRHYAGFDTGIATGFMLLAATEMGLVAHPIAGYDPTRVRAVLEIPERYEVITMVVFGLHDLAAAEGDPKEMTRPDRLPVGEFAWMNRYGGK